MSHSTEHARERTADPPGLVDWPTSVGLAVGGTIVAVALILLLSYMVDWIGEFWPQIFAFTLVLGTILWLAGRDRRKDERDPARRRRGASVTPAGLPGPFVVTQALGILGLTMIVVGGILTFFADDDRGLLWFGGGWVLWLVGMVGLIFWLLGLRAGTRRGERQES